MIILIIILVVFLILISFMAMKFAQHMDDDWEENESPKSYMKDVINTKLDNVDDYYEFIRMDKPAPMKIVKDDIAAKTPKRKYVKKSIKK